MKATTLHHSPEAIISREISETAGPSGRAYTCREATRLTDRMTFMATALSSVQKALEQDCRVARSRDNRATVHGSTASKEATSPVSKATVHVTTTRNSRAREATSPVSKAIVHAITIKDSRAREATSPVSKAIAHITTIIKDNRAREATSLVSKATAHAITTHMHNQVKREATSLASKATSPIWEAISLVKAAMASSVVATA